MNLLELRVPAALEQYADLGRVRPEGTDDDALASWMRAEKVVRVRVIPPEDQLEFFVGFQAASSSSRRIARTGTCTQSGLLASS
jgi:hypothetical protein